MLSQVMRDLKVEPELEVPGQSSQATWRAQALAFLIEQAAADGEIPSSRKLYRVAAHDWLCALEQMLTSFFGRGLSHVKAEGITGDLSGEDIADEPIPILTLTLDQCCGLLCCLVFDQPPAHGHCLAARCIPWQP